MHRLEAVGKVGASQTTKISLVSCKMPRVGGSACALGCPDPICRTLDPHFFCGGRVGSCSCSRRRHKGSLLPKAKKDHGREGQPQDQKPSAGVEPRL